MSELVLIHPPVALPTEPPVGLAVLSAQLEGAGLPVSVIDANIGGLHALLAEAALPEAASVRERRAIALREQALLQLRTAHGYQHPQRYNAAVSTLRDLLRLAGKTGHARVSLGLADYRDERLSPLSSADLRAALGAFKESPFAAYFGTLMPRIRAENPRLLGLSLNYLHQVLPAFALVGMLRAHFPAIPIWLGGALFASWRDRLNPEAFRPSVDRIVFGDGVEAVLEYFSRALPDPSRKLPPSYDGLPWDQYLAPGKILPLSTSQGCFWSRCNYCPEALAQPGFSSQYPGELLPITRALIEAHRPALIHFTDSAIPPENLAELAELEGGVPWYGFARFLPALTDPAFCRKLRRSGCVMLQLGLESGSERVLQRLRKGIGLPMASAALRALSDEGIGVYLYLMFGTPGEDREDALRTLEFVARHAAQIGFLNLSLLNLPRNHPREDSITTRPIRGDYDLSLYEAFKSDQGWDRLAARRFVQQEFTRDPAISPIVRRTPMVFGANHAPFFLLGK